MAVPILQTEKKALFTVLLVDRAMAVIFFKHSGKVGRVGIAAQGGGGLDAVSAAQAAVCLLHAHPDQIFLQGLTRLVLEQPGQIASIQVQFPGNGFHRNVLHIAALDMIFHLFSWFLGKSSVLITNHNNRAIFLFDVFQFAEFSFLNENKQSLSSGIHSPIYRLSFSLFYLCILRGLINWILQPSKSWSFLPKAIFINLS